MAFQDGGPSLRRTWARLRGTGSAADTGSPRRGDAPLLPWHAQPLAPRVDIEDKAAVLAALERRR